MKDIHIKNKEARFKYEILESFEAGIQLKGDEIKAVRASRVNLRGSYAKILYSCGKPELFLVGAHFHTFTGDPYRTRKLLLKSEEIKRLIGKTIEKGLTVLPLAIYIKRGRAKVEIALGKGRKLHDKRELLKQRDLDREVRKSV